MPTPQPQPVAPTPLERALDQSEAIHEVVKQSGAELFVINTVLKQELPEDVQTSEVAQALQKTDVLEAQIQESAEDLAKVNEMLEEEIDQRASLERELQATRAALAQATGRSVP